MNSLMVHAAKYFQPSTLAGEPNPQVYEAVLHHAELAYKPVIWTLPDDFDSKERFESLVTRLDMKSSPGLPYCQEAPTNGEWLKWNGITCDPIQLNRLWYDTKLVLADEWETILRVFVKQEPHKLTKMLDGRLRLIMAAPLCVQMAWNMLFSYMNDLENEKCYHIPSQQGVVLVGGGWKDYYRQWTAKGLSCGLDKSSWDWTAPYWTLRMDLEFRHRMGRGDRLEEWRRIAGVLYRHMFEDPIIQLPDGNMYQQEVPGVMKSGCINTISTNSHCQIFVHIAANIMAGIDIYPLPVACGDDTLQHEKHTHDLHHYERLGVVIKEVSTTMEFVGHEFTDRGPKPNYLMKHLKHLEYVKSEDLSQYLDQMARMYIHTDYYDWWEYVARAVGKPLPLSRKAYQYWYDFEATNICDMF